LAHELESLPACAQLAAAFITYLPAAPEDVRKEMLHEWMEMTQMKSERYVALPFVRPGLQHWLREVIAAVSCEVT